MKLKKKITMDNDLFQDLAEIKIPHPTKNKDQKLAGRKLKAFIVFLYAISIILLYIGITMPVDTQISLSAILFNTRKVVVLGIVGLFSFIINKLSEPFCSENPKILFSKLIFSLIFTLIMVIFVLPHFMFNAKNPTIGLFYFVEILLIIVVVLTGQNLIDLFIS
jgi:magnesium-transporting ATPase (P-type)